ncbi:MAG: hypothetical protein ABSE73_16530 [Planctomycetota bacterium]
MLYGQYQQVLSWPGAILVSLVQIATFCLKYSGLIGLPGATGMEIGRFALLMAMRPDTPHSQEQYEEQAVLYLSLMTAADPQTPLITGQVQCQAPERYRRTLIPAVIQEAINAVNGTAKLLVVDPALANWKYRSEPFTPTPDCPRLLVAILENPHSRQFGTDDMRHHYIVLGTWPNDHRSNPPPKASASIPAQIIPPPPEEKTRTTLATILGL